MKVDHFDLLTFPSWCDYSEEAEKTAEPEKTEKQRQKTTESRTSGLRFARFEETPKHQVQLWRKWEVII